jgi:flagellar FliJ protein
MAMRKPGHYATLLRVRKHEEELRSATLAGTRREIAQAEMDLEAIREQQRRTLETAGIIARERLDAEDIRRYYQFERHLAQLAVEKDAQIQALQARASKEQAALAEATKRRRMTEKLEERVAESYRREMGILEQKQLDQVASNYHALKGSQLHIDTGEGR